MELTNGGWRNRARALKPEAKAPEDLGAARGRRNRQMIGRSGGEWRWKVLEEVAKKGEEKGGFAAVGLLLL
jgi:hypothetical protein